MYKVIITGTDPESRMGGIGFSLPGYLCAMKSIGIDYESIPSYHPSIAGGSWWWWLRSFPRVLKVIVSSRRSGLPVIVYSHAGAGVSLFREGLLMAFCKLCGAKTIMQLHAMEVDIYLKSTLKRNLFKLAISPVSSVSVLTQWWSDALVNSGVKKQVFVIPNPLPAAWEEKASMAQCLNLDEKNKFTVLTMTRVESGKGVGLVIDVIQLVPAYVKFIIAGDGRLLDEMKEKAQELGVEHRISFEGWVSGKEKQQLIDQADLYLLPTTYDSFGMGFLELMANGVPVVALKWGPIPDVVKNECAGILVEEGSPEKLAEAIIRLMCPKLRKKMSDGARGWVLERFKPEHVGKLLHAMFIGVLTK